MIKLFYQKYDIEPWKLLLRKGRIESMDDVYTANVHWQMKQKGSVGQLLSNEYPGDTNSAL